MNFCMKRMVGDIEVTFSTDKPLEPVAVQRIFDLLKGLEANHTEAPRADRGSVIMSAWKCPDCEKLASKKAWLSNTHNDALEQSLASCPHCGNSRSVAMLEKGRVQLENPTTTNTA